MASAFAGIISVLTSLDPEVEYSSRFSEHIIFIAIILTRIYFHENATSLLLLTNIGKLRTFIKYLPTCNLYKSCHVGRKTCLSAYEMPIKFMIKSFYPIYLHRMTQFPPFLAHVLCTFHYTVALPKVE